MTNTLRAKSIEILLVEDNEGDIRLTFEALKDAQVKNTLQVVRDGEEAIAYLRREPPHEDATRPDLVLLDLNLPKIDGREVLKFIKSTATLRRIPVIVLTTSTAEQDILGSYEQYANGYVTKPVDFDQFFQIVQAIEGFWLSVVTLPAEDD